MSNDQPVRALLIPLDSGGEGGGIRFSELISAARRFRLAIVILAFACIAGAVLAFFFVESKYQATTTFILSEESQASSSLGALGSQFGSLASLAGISLPSGGGIKAEAFATLESRELLRNFIVAEDLIPILFAKKWDSENSVWDTDSGSAPSIAKAVKLFQDNVLTIERETSNDIVHLSVTWSDPELCEYWANELVRRVNSKLSMRAKSEAVQSIEFLEKELEKTSNAQIQNSVFALIEQQMSITMVANVRADYAFRVIDPATVPDSDDPEWPSLFLLLVVAGCLWALICCSLLVVVAVRGRSSKPNQGRR